jgi:hypothetical protein
LEDLDAEVEINSACEVVRESIKVSFKESMGYFELKKHKPWFDEGFSKLLDQWKQAKLQWLHYRSEVNGDNLNNLRCEVSRHRLRVFENRVLMRIFGPKRDEVTGEWRKLHNKELHDLYSSPSIIRIIKPRRMRWAGHVARMGEKRIAYRLLVGKPEGTRPLGRPRRRWVDNIRMDLEEVGWGDVDWIGLALHRNWWRALVNSVLNLRVP